ncbi:MAG: putative transporter binding protein [Chloroflexi bacterium]|jgi:iron(III) transport system ATP-binding protein|nr:putative transporter binding protein [Chloroflexota bacterium]
MVQLDRNETPVAAAVKDETQAWSEVIRLDNVSKTYSGSSRPAVDNISFGLKSGELLALLGPSGCGKTTTLRLIAGFERPDRGQIQVKGQPVAAAGLSWWQPPEKRQLGVVFQDYALFPHLTVSQNIVFGLRRVSRQAAKERLAELLKVTGLTDFSHKYPHQLSGGQQQRVALARAMAPRPMALLLDEAFNSLDTTIRSAMHQEVRSILKAEGISAILVTHDQAEAFELADRMAVLNSGRIEQIGTPQGVFRQPANHFVAQFVGRANFLPARLEQGRVESELGRLSGQINLNADAVEAGDFDLLLRPHEIELFPASNETGPVATVASRIYAGAESLYSVQLSSTGQILEAASSKDFSIGQKVNLAAKPDVINLYPREAKGLAG